jgi:hypothetical protein
MAEALAFNVLQIVVPVGLAALPGLWKQIRTVLQRIRKKIKDNKNFTCINTISDTLAQVPDQDLGEQLSHNQPLLIKIRLKAEALEKTLSRNAFPCLKFCRRAKATIVQEIKDIAVLMQLLDHNIRNRQYSEKPKQVNILTQPSIRFIACCPLSMEFVGQ